MRSGGLREMLVLFLCSIFANKVEKLFEKVETQTEYLSVEISLSALEKWHSSNDEHSSSDLP